MNCGNPEGHESRDGDPSPIDLSAILPVVLVGGQSRRFGRNKLLEPVADGKVLVDLPIAALRGVFGPRVALCGRCDPEVARRGDSHIEDRYPGAGPLGAIVSALHAANAAGLSGIFVLAGDLPAVTHEVVRAILEGGAAQPRAIAVLGRTDRPQPCIALYKVECLGALENSPLSEQGLGTAGSLMKRIAEIGLLAAEIDIDARSAVNVNTPEDWALARQ